MIVTVRNLSPSRKSKFSRFIDALSLGDVVGCWLIGTLMSGFGLMFARIDAEFAKYLSQALVIGSVPFWVGMVVVTVAILLRNKSHV